MRTTTVDTRRAEIEARRALRAPFLENGGGSGVSVALGGLLGFIIGALLLLPVVAPVTVFEALACVLLSLGGAAGGWLVAQSTDEQRSREAHSEQLRTCEAALRRVRVLIRATGRRDSGETCTPHFTAALAPRRAPNLAGPEREHGGGSFALDELQYREGFEAAMHVFVRGKSRSDFLGLLASRSPEILDSRPFRFGYERGRTYAAERRLTVCGDAPGDGASQGRVD